MSGYWMDNWRIMSMSMLFVIKLPIYYVMLFADNVLRDAWCPCIEESVYLCRLKNNEKLLRCTVNLDTVSSIQFIDTNVNNYIKSM